MACGAYTQGKLTLLLILYFKILSPLITNGLFLDYFFVRGLISFLHINKKPASTCISTVVPYIVNFHAAALGVIALAGQIDGTLKSLLQD